jgi:hypothetical protein
VKLLLSSVATVVLVLGNAILPAQPQPEAKAGTVKGAARTVTGTVRSSSADAVVVTGRDRGKEAEWTFAVEPRTTIRKGSKSIVSADLKPGDGVQVRFVERNGKAHAESIRVKEVRKEAAKK